MSTPEPAVSALPDFPGNLTTPPIPSPFSSSSSSASDVSPMVPQFREPEPVVEPVPSTPFEPPVPSSPFEQQASGPFDQQPVFQPSASTPQEQQMAQSEWTPPPVPEAGFQNPEFGQSPPPPAAGSGQSKGLAITSLILGILSLLCCNWFIVGLAAIITGFIARSKAGSNPSQYGGGGMALGGIIAGVVSFIIGILVWVLYFFGFLAGIIGSMK